MKTLWLRFQRGPWWWRVPAKALLMAVTVFLVCYPNPFLFVRHVKHWQNPNAMIDPDAAELEPMLRELEPKLAETPPGREALKIVQRFVYDRIKYEWDWNTWGAADYLPTLAEVLEKGKEDCDGRAVVAASLLRNLGYQADLVTDLTHVWVKTDHGETMGPGPGPKTAIATDTGLRIDWAAYFKNAPKSLAYGLAVFPLWRELVVVAMLWLLALLPGMGRLWVIGGLLLMVDGLLLTRYGAKDAWRFDAVGTWFGLFNLMLAVVVLYGSSWRARRGQPSGITGPDQVPKQV